MIQINTQGQIARYQARRPVPQPQPRYILAETNTIPNLDDTQQPPLSLIEDAKKVPVWIWFAVAVFVLRRK